MPRLDRDGTGNLGVLGTTLESTELPNWGRDGKLMNEKPKIPKMRETGITGRGKGIMRELKSSYCGKERDYSHKEKAGRSP